MATTLLAEGHQRHKRRNYKPNLSNIVTENGANKAIYREIGLISENRNGVVSYYQLNGTGGVAGQTNTAGEMIKSFLRF